MQRALDFAIGEGFIQHVGGKAVVLTSNGKRLADEIVRSDTILISEKKFIDSVNQKVSEELVKQMFGWKD